jgi:hypothetical protein
MGGRKLVCGCQVPHCAHLMVRRVSRFEVVAFRARVFKERHWGLTN